MSKSKTNLATLGSPGFAIYGKPPKTIAQVRAIIRAELDYWERNATKAHDISLGATGALANVLAATSGLRAPWHPLPSGLVPPVCRVPGCGEPCQHYYGGSGKPDEPGGFSVQCVGHNLLKAEKQRAAAAKRKARESK